MMKIDSSTVARIAHLARINITDQEAEHTQKSLTQIFNWIQQLDQVDTADVKPLFSAHIKELVQYDDVIQDGNYVDDILSNAPDQAFNMFAVPKVIE